MTNTLRGRFLQDFFAAGGNHPNPDEARRVFDQAFVLPPSLASIAEAARTRGRKVLIIDGHPRSGKTWSAIRIVADLIVEMGLTETDYWTSGLDSLKVAPDDGVDLLSVLRSAADAALGNGPRRLIFLDDILGTNRFRPVGDFLRVRAEIGGYLRWDKDNLFLRALSEESLLVITGRSLHVTLAALMFDVDLMRSHAPDYVVVLNSRRGLFRTSGKGDPFGTFDPPSLKEVCRRNRSFHTLKRPAEANWLLAAAPLLAFDSETPVSDLQKRLAARTLFGDDLRCVALKVAELEEELLKPDPHGWTASVLSSLRTAYLVMIAPGVVFLDPAAYEALGVKNESSEKLIRSLYLFEREGVFRSGRLPNEMYMLAVDDHMHEFLEFAARTFVSLASQARAEDIVPPLGLRGFVERGLHVDGKQGLHRLLSVLEFKDYADAHQDQTKDPFLYLELTQILPDEGYGNRGAGLAAAFGWSLHNFSGVYGPEVLAEALQEWFGRYFGHYLEPCSSPEHVPDAVVIYSTFLQWAIKICDKEKRDGAAPDWAAGVIALCDGASEPMRKNLQMILEDEIVWAVNENFVLSPSVNRLIETREAELMRDLAGDAIRDDEMDVNRFFSLAWHNEWMERTASSRTDGFRKWMSLHADRLIDLLEREPQRIAANLRYHWIHFVTQRAVWMRDWCFSDNPLEFERNYSGIASGSRNADYNADFERIALAILNSGPADSIKTVLLLAGTRAARLRRFSEISREIERRLACGPPELRMALLHAVFELVRQGFFETTDEADACRSLCADILNQSDEVVVHDAWSSYWESLKRHTHHDVLPRKREGWRDMQQALRREV